MHFGFRLAILKASFDCMDVICVYHYLQCKFLHFYSSTDNRTRNPLGSHELGSVSIDMCFSVSSILCMPKAFTTEFDVQRLKSLRGQLQRVVGNLHAVIDYMEENDTNLWIYNASSMEQGLPWIVSFANEAIKSLAAHESGEPYHKDSSKGRVSKKKKATKKKSPKKK